MPHKILVVEDDADAAEMLQLRLEAGGYDVAIAANGKEGLLKVDSERPDLIVCDVTMPVMDGFSFVRDLHAKPQTKRIPVIVLTGKDKMQELFQFEGVRDYLVKPCQAGELLEKIKRHLKTA